MSATAKQVGFFPSIICLCLFVFFFPALACATPKIFYTDIESGPNTGGENNNGAYLSIFGKGFGTSGLGTSVKVYVGNGEVARYIYLGPSLGRPDVQEIGVQLGPNTSTGAIKVTVNGVASNTDHSFTVRPGNFYFISPAGKNSKGVKNDITHPYGSANYVINLSSFQAGDFIIALPGTYVLANTDAPSNANSWLRADKSGTAAAPMVFLGYPNGAVNVQHSNASYLFSNYVSIAYWVVGNFKVSLTDCVGAGEIMMLGSPTTTSICRGGPGGTVSGKASFIKVVNIESDGHDQAGFCSGGDGWIEINYSNDVRLLGVSLHNTSPAQGDNESAHAIYLSTTQQNTEVGWNALYNIPATRAVVQVHQDAFGGVCWSGKQLTDIKIHDNLLHDLGGQAILLDGGTGDIQVYNNLIYNHRDHRYGDVIGLRAGGRKLNLAFYNNTVYANARAAQQGTLLDIGYNSGMPAHVTLYNNIFYTPDAQDLYYDTEVNGGMAAFNAWVAAGNLTSDNNLWYGSGSGKPPFAGPHELHVDPKFVNPGKGDLRLQRASPAIGKGSSRVSPIVSYDHDMNPRGNGHGYDLGAYQYQSSHD